MKAILSRINESVKHMISLNKKTSFLHEIEQKSLDNLLNLFVGN